MPDPDTGPRDSPESRSRVDDGSTRGGRDGGERSEEQDDSDEGVQAPLTWLFETAAGGESESRGRSVSRRRVIAAAGLGAGAVAGCTGPSGNGSSDDDDDDGSTPATRAGTTTGEALPFLEDPTTTPPPDDPETVTTLPPAEEETTARQRVEPVTLKLAGDQILAERQNAINRKLTDLGLETVDIDVLAGSQITDQRQARYNQWLNAGRAEPTLLMMDSGWTIPFIARDQIKNLSDLLPDSLLGRIDDTYFEASVRTARGASGDLYGVPLFVDFPTMQYRKDVLREAGYSGSDFRQWATDPPSWAAFSRITAQGIDALGNMGGGSSRPYGFTFQAQAYEGLSCCDFNEWLTSWGGAYFGDPTENLFANVGSRPITVDEQPVVDSIRMVRTFIHGSDDPVSLDRFEGDIAPQAVVQWTEEPSRKPFSNGRAVMHRNWPYSININGSRNNYGEDLGVMPLPYAVTTSEARYPMTGGPVAALGGWHVAVNPNAPQAKLDGAARLLEVMATEEFQLFMFEQIGWLPPRTRLFNSSRAKNVPIMGRYLDSLQVAGANAIPRPVTVLWPRESEQIYRQVNATLAQDKRPERAMADLKSDLDRIESDYGW